MKNENKRQCKLDKQTTTSNRLYGGAVAAVRSKTLLRVALLFTMLALLLNLTTLLTHAQNRATNARLIVSNDPKVTYLPDGTGVFGAPGKESISIIDIGTDPTSPRILVNLPLPVSMFGPPVNVAITPDERLAIAVNSTDVMQQGAEWKPVPSNKLHVIDLTANPPALLRTIEVGRRPTGIAINSRGDMALITFRVDKAVGVFSIQGNEVKLIDTVQLGDETGPVAFTPDGRRALVGKIATNKIAVLDINGQQVTYDKTKDMAVGPYPYNVDITPDGRLALSVDNGNDGPSDGMVDTVSVIDIEANPARVIDRIVVGDGPDGLAISPTGRVAVAVLQRGANAKAKWFYHPNSALAVLRIDGKRVTKIDEVEVGAMAEAIAFSPDGKHLYVGNFLDSNIHVLKVDGTKVTNTGKRLQLPGTPTAMRGRSR